MAKKKKNKKQKKYSTSKTSNNKKVMSDNSDSKLSQELQELKSKLKKIKTPSFSNYEFSRKYFKYASYVATGSAGFTISYFIRHKGISITECNLNLVICILMVFFYLCASRAFFIRSIECPYESKKDVEVWLWEMGKKLYILSFSAYSSFVLSLILSNIMESSISNLFLFVSWLFLFLFMFCLSIIYWNPRLFWSNLLVGFGSGIVRIGFLLIPASIYFSNIFPDEHSKNVFTLIALILSFLSIYNGITSLSKDKLYLLQNHALKIIPASRIINSFRLNSNYFQEHFRALEIINELEEHGDYGTQAALLRLLAKRYQKKSKIIAGLILSLILFILAAIGEAFFQDIFYEPIKAFWKNFKL